MDVHDIFFKIYNVYEETIKSHKPTKGLKELVEPIVKSICSSSAWAIHKLKIEIDQLKAEISELKQKDK